MGYDGDALGNGGGLQRVEAGTGPQVKVVWEMGLLLRGIVVAVRPAN